MNIEKYLENDEMTAFCRTNIPPKYYFKPYVRNNKSELKKPVRLTSFQKPQ